MNAVLTFTVFKKGKMYENDFNGNTLKDSWDEKMKRKNKKKQNKNGKEKNMGCHISLTPFLAVVSPRAATMAKY